MFIIVSNIPLGMFTVQWPCAGPGSCRTGLICFLVGWRKRRPEPGFSFIRFGFAYVSNCCLSFYVVTWLIVRGK